MRTSSLFILMTAVAMMAPIACDGRNIDDVVTENENAGNGNTEQNDAVVMFCDVDDASSAVSLLDLSGAGEIRKVGVCADVEWDLECKADWIAISNHFGNPTGGKPFVVTVTASENTTGQKRIAEMILTGSGQTSSLSVEQGTTENQVVPDPVKVCKVTSPKLGTGAANPILDFQFCADPTAVEYNGRLYVYGTNDHQQYQEAEENTYEKIRSLVMMSTDDMVNWTYHGLIPVGEIAPWIIASWAPSIISKPQEDGSTLFSLYFSNSGWGTGVIQAKSPVGPWTSPLSTSLIDGNNETVKDSGAIFDPGAVIDDNGDAWLSFGNSQGWIAKLNPDLHSFGTTPVKLLTPYHFEANELNYINGTYVYTYNNDWTDHTPWELGGEKPTACSMIYMKSTDPLNTDSWTYGGNYFKNPGENGMGYGNNHTHLHKYQGKWYLFYHTGLLGASFKTEGGFRSLYVDEIEVDEQNVVIKECKPTHKGVSAIRNLDPYKMQYAATNAATLGILYRQEGQEGHMVATVGTPCIDDDEPAASIIEVRNVEFTGKAAAMKCLVKGEGSVTLRLDDKDAADVLTVTGSADEWQEISASAAENLNGIHTVYFILNGDIQFDTWQFVEE